GALRVVLHRARILVRIGDDPAVVADQRQARAGLGPEAREAGLQAARLAALELARGERSQDPALVLQHRAQLVEQTPLQALLDLPSDEHAGEDQQRRVRREEVPEEA